MWRRHPIFCGLAGLSLLLCAAVAVMWIILSLDNSPKGHPQDRFSALVINMDLHVSWPDPDAMWWSVPNRNHYNLLGVEVIVWEWNNGAQWWLLGMPMIYLVLQPSLPVASAWRDA